MTLLRKHHLNHKFPVFPCWSFLEVFDFALADLHFDRRQSGFFDSHVNFVGQIFLEVTLQLGGESLLLRQALLAVEYLFGAFCVVVTDLRLDYSIFMFILF